MQLRMGGKADGWTRLDFHARAPGCQSQARFKQDPGTYRGRSTALPVEGPRRRRHQKRQSKNSISAVRRNITTGFSDNSLTYREKGAEPCRLCSVNARIDQAKVEPITATLYHDTDLVADAYAPLSPPLRQGSSRMFCGKY